MEIILSKNCGFCPGVKRADKVIRTLISKKTDDELIFTLGELIHNNTYIKELESYGVYSIDVNEIDQIVSENKEKNNN